MLVVKLCIFFVLVVIMMCLLEECKKCVIVLGVLWIMCVCGLVLEKVLLFFSVVNNGFRLFLNVFVGWLKLIVVVLLEIVV